MTVHWIGVGLSAVPGIKRLLHSNLDVQVWNRSTDKAKNALAEMANQANITAFSLEKLGNSLKAGDIVVSMLPGNWHVPIAEQCLANKAHFVSSSYISPEMHALDAQAKQLGLVFLNEIGLDPGLDHLLAHKLVQQYRIFRENAPNADQHELSFKSYCGGLSAQKNSFCYKFSWSPLGVLKALLSPSKSILNHAEHVVERPWLAVENYDLDFDDHSETFEVYPNRDSIPFLSDYQFSDNWKVKNFVRGTLRYGGWKKSWADIFDFMENLSKQSNPDQALEALSDQLWQDNPLNDGEHDRVVLTVDLKVESEGVVVWHQDFILDAIGTDQATAMARLVSEPVAMFVEQLSQGAFSAGVQPAPANAKIFQPILNEMAQHCRLFVLNDHISTEKIHYN